MESPDVNDHRPDAKPMRLKFTKMQGVGNDFVVLDAVNQPVSLDAEAARRIADRHFGVGCDQILLIEPPRTPGTDFYYRIFNADGGEVQHCGNGARCFLRYVRDKGLTSKTEIRVETLSGVIVPRLEADGQVTVDMGAPEFAPAKIPFIADRQALTYWLEVDGGPVEISVLSMGNPHAVQIAEDVERAPVLTQGPLIERHARFPQRANAGYLQPIDRHRAALRVYERGAGETLACGTGACAAVVAGITRGYLDSPVTVRTHGGLLVIAWGGGRQSVMMTGPAQTVFEGEIDL
jgi:diaminopimelate epimerase